ncbi:EF-hand calcium-binding domain-containing protein 1-like [Mizuhopecten yessoensis]|uniref:EF-hand calcium-binding domain-containing protein 1 n=1 Tax=Mizuhopecten yessoensis TaxID=6573 RepID=A0A210Q9J6_MIZYE|nr:EF-hand calcium-binding domain-containing protein 1-like [Mizuhopecten yessoensis]OWF45413.1 EF-hand calcium-binding domain-containing protein 1 [Mizuhopecten yessoensis]
MTSKRKELQKLVEKLSKKKDIHFNRQQIEKLIYKFSDLHGGRTLMDKNHVARMERGMFRDILYNYFSMTDDVLLDRVFRAFDKDSDNYINVEEWINGMSVFLRGLKEERIKFCFCAYDLNGDGYISREEMFQLLKTSLSRTSTDEDQDESIKELVEITLKKMDDDHDGRVSFEDYKKGIEEDPLMMEFLGPCLPERKRCDFFLEEIEQLGKY